MESRRHLLAFQPNISSRVTSPGILTVIQIASRKVFAKGYYHTECAQGDLGAGKQEIIC